MPTGYELEAPESLLSPSLLVYREKVWKNLQAMLALARQPERLRPHVKTHKMPEIVRMTERAGIHKHKCATIAEAEMIALAGGQDVLLAYPLVGPNIKRFVRLLETYPQTRFRATVDHPDAARALSAALSRPVPVLLDLEIGMGRTGLPPDERAEALYQLIVELPHLEPDGLHAYDGQVQVSDPAERRRAARPGQEATLRLRDRLQTRGWPVPRLVFGGTPSFPVHTQLDEPNVECSPGTCVLHDAGYAARFPDLPFTIAAALLTRVVSQPGPNRLCLDLGHKAVAGDPPAGSRVHLPGLPDARFSTHSEEHLVIETERAEAFPIGSTLIAFPTHICPTCALHRRAYAIDEAGRCFDTWEVAARDRLLTV